MAKKTSALEMSLPSSCAFMTRLLAPSSRLSVVSMSSAYSPIRPVAELMRSSSTMNFLSSAGVILPAATLPWYSAARAAASRRTAFMSRTMRGSSRLAYSALKSHMTFSDPSFAAFIDSSLRACLFGHLMIPHNTGVSTAPIRHFRLPLRHLRFPFCHSPPSISFQCEGCSRRMRESMRFVEGCSQSVTVSEPSRECYRCEVAVRHNAAILMQRAKTRCMLESKGVLTVESDTEAMARVVVTRPENTPHQAAFWKVSGSFLSKVLGFVRDVLVAKIFGATYIVDVAQLVENVLLNIVSFITSPISIPLVPELTHARLQSE